MSPSDPVLSHAGHRHPAHSALQGAPKHNCRHWPVTKGPLRLFRLVLNLNFTDTINSSDYAQGLGNQDYSQLYAQYQNVPGSNNGFADVAIAPFVDQAVQLPVPVKEQPVPVKQQAPVVEQPANPPANVNPPVIAAAPAPVQPEVKPEPNLGKPVEQKPVEPEKPAEPARAMFQGGEKAEHAMMLQDDVKVAVKEKKDPLPMPALKQGLTESKEYRGDVVWPTMAELQVPQEIKDKHEEWYKLGINRQRQKVIISIIMIIINIT